MQYDLAVCKRPVGWVECGLQPAHERVDRVHERREKYGIGRDVRLVRCEEFVRRGGRDRGTATTSLFPFQIIAREGLAVSPAPGRTIADLSTRRYVP